MHDALCMRVLQTLCRLHNATHRRLDGKRPLLRKHVRQVAAFDILHRQVVQAMCFAGIVGCDDVRMHEPRGKLDFLIEALHHRVGVGRLRRQHLERDDTLHASMLRLVDLPHPSGAEFVEHQVLAKEEAFAAPLVNILGLIPSEQPLLDQITGDGIGSGTQLLGAQRLAKAGDFRGGNQVERRYALEKLRGIHA